MNQLGLFDTPTDARATAAKIGASVKANVAKQTRRRRRRKPDPKPAVATVTGKRAVAKAADAIPASPARVYAGLHEGVWRAYRLVKTERMWIGPAFESAPDAIAFARSMNARGADVFAFPEGVKRGNPFAGKIYKRWRPTAKERRAMAAEAGELVPAPKKRRRRTKRR